MKKIFIAVFAACSLVACLPEVGTGGADSNGDSNNTDSGPLSADIMLTTDNSATTNYPLAVKAEITASAGSTYEVKLGDTVIESGNMPSNALLQGPFSGITDGNNKRLVYFVIGESGEHEVSVVIEKNDEIVTDSESLTIGAASCDNNPSFYENENLSSNFSCGDCHESGGTASFIIDGSSVTTIAAVPKFNAADPYIFANTPANLDRTPGDNTFGGEYSHSGGVRWSPDSEAHFRVLELAYRIRNDFSCPL
jgi:hypothetical protein